VDFTRPARELAAHVRAMTPWPGALCETPRGPLKLLRAGAVDALGRDLVAEPGPPGRVVAADPERGLLVAAGEGTVAVLECQRPGKQAMTAAEYLRGLREDPVGELWRAPAAQGEASRE
jgi:methionyl-tRNA formyltransferase